MAMVHPGGPVIGRPQRSDSASVLGKVLSIFSVLTMLSTVPQVVAVWSGAAVGGVSVVTWLTYLLSALLWLVHGIQKRDRSIYLACIGWILLDAAVVAGVLLHH
jgi:uncharacterized protein with PQ loop repeat